MIQLGSVGYRDFADEAHAVYFCRFCMPIPAGPDGADDDYRVHMENLGAAVQTAVKHPDRLATVILLDSGYPPPHAVLRAQLVKFTTQPNFDPIVAFVTSNMAIRGVLTALRWFRKPTHEEKVFARAEDAFEWLLQRRNEPMGDNVRKRLAEVATEAQAKSIG